ncbi:MAG TPA: rhomboid family intramembrane serine protease [Nitrososphaeraceae archaeon]|nr:rhomboid family intramembrane serine protease [Nitrososphaeraceae archaeon]
MFPIHDDTPRLHGRPYVNYSLIALNVIIFIWEVLRTNFFRNELIVNEIFFTYGTVPDLVFQGDFFPLVTSMFLHGGVAHIIGNMVFLYIFGDNIEDRFGHFKYLILYLFWGIAAGIIHSFYAVSVGGGDIPAVGASGAISGVLGAYLILFPRAKIFTIIIAFFVTTIRIPALAYIPIWFILQVVFSILNPEGGVAYLAHIGGFIVGAGVSYLTKSLFPSFFQGHIDGGGSNYLKKSRPYSRRMYQDNPRQSISQPDIIEGDNYYEILVELKGLRNIHNLRAMYEASTHNLQIFSEGSINPIVSIPLREEMRISVIQDVSYINGILRVRMLKS